ncbi:NADH-quinone oxidoreductase subunit NuoK [Anaerovibrio sp.]|uniref:NADH-quinone oxidoreductase subunit NuoK n=1 Tax=Anaerovibrio sp. TaxID=1872532 RepID=UPI001B72A5BC|nr:NADH-quinone oxidoreductase subunit NuoK [Anaerovibrio sp.]MBP3232492.1 NADH-quinone oxidoreductase subunit NuoK [Anaerovibrio sp.]MBR2142275.1 NADH-quinone oxidoreductase subunit NuoK [Anaerovibrio sp.]
MTIGLNHCLLLAAMLFAIGLYGVLSKRNIIAVLMGVELMLNAVNINFVAFNRFTPVSDLTGQLMTVFAITVGVAEVAIGVALAYRIYNDRNTINVDELDNMKG